MSDELQQMLDSVHDGITTFDFEGKETSCILIEEEKYGLIRAKIEGQPFSVNTDLNILQDGLGNVFVEIILTFSIGNISEKFLVNAKTDLKFFEVLAIWWPHQVHFGVVAGLSSSAGNYASPGYECRHSL